MVTMLKPRLQQAAGKLTTKRPTERIRGSAWMAIRARILKREPRCAMCLAKGELNPAVIVDHRTPLFEGGSNDDSNLQGLCIPHHDAKSAEEEKRRRGLV